MMAEIYKLHTKTAVFGYCSHCKKRLFFLHEDEWGVELRRGTLVCASSQMWESEAHSH